MKGMKISHQTYFASPETEARSGLGVQAVTYTSSTGLSQIECLQMAKPDRPSVAYLRLSSNNGATWSLSRPFHRAEETGEGDVRFGNYLFFQDHEHDLLLLIYYKQFIVGDDVFAAAATTRMYVQISRDGAESWEDPLQIIDAREGYDTDHWAPGVACGKIAGFTAGILHVEKRRDGALMLPCQIGQTSHFLKQGVFIGRWKSDLSAIEWEMSQYAEAHGNFSSRGVFAGSLVELNDGRILMAMRGSSKGTDYPGDVAPVTVSDDGGMTWAKPSVLTYEDGSTVWVASANPHLFRAERNGKVYCLLHVQTEPRIGHPRYPLCLGEIDEETLTLRHESVTTIMTREPDDIEAAYYEPRGFIQDRESGRIILFIGDRNKLGIMRVIRTELELPL